MRTHEVHTQSISLELLADQFLNVLDGLAGARETVQIVVHSWGALVVAAAAARDPLLLARTINGGLFINPVPLDRAAYDQSVRNFVSSIPYHIRLGAPILAVCGVSGTYIIRLLWPFYGSKRGDNAPPPANFSFDFRTYTAVTQNLGDFNYSTVLPNLKHLSLVLSSTDPTTPSLIQDWLKLAKCVETIDDGGHFPLQANPNAWMEKLRDLLNRRSA